MARDRNLLCDFGGHIDLSRNWALSIMSRMNLVKRRGTTSAKASVSNFDDLKEGFLDRIRSKVEEFDIPDELVINWDQTGIPIVPVSTWTMAPEGSKRVDIRGLDDKRQITGMLAGTIHGDFLPYQLIYQGKTDKCHPKYSFPKDWDITHSPNHWSNSETMESYLDNVLFPYVMSVKERLDLPLAQKSLVIFDVFRAQVTEDFRNKLRQKHFVYVTVPACCTDKLQQMDLSINKVFKDKMKEKFQMWYREQVREQLKHDADPVPSKIDLGLCAMKSISAKWLYDTHVYMKKNPNLIVSGFREAGIVNSLRELRGYKTR